MKEVQITLPTDRKSIINEFLTDFSLQAISYDFGEATRFELRIDDYQTNIIIEELKARGIGVAYGNIVVRPVSLVISSESKDARDILPKSAGVNRAEILANLGEISGLSSIFILLNALAATLATFGLIYNNAVVIIASMIVAPLLGPILLTSLGLLSLETTSLIKRGLLALISGISITIIVAGLFGLIIKLFLRIDVDINVLSGEATEIINRTTLDFSAVALALLGGLAAGIIVARGLDVSIVGVAIAASLCPPAATIGILAAMGLWDLTIRAASLLLLNVLAINFSCTGVFWTFGVKSRGLSKRHSAKVKRMNIIWMIIVAFLMILIIYYYLIYYPSVFPSVLFS